jgi:hypothetical protein
MSIYLSQKTATLKNKKFAYTLTQNYYKPPHPTLFFPHAALLNGSSFNTLTSRIECPSSTIEPWQKKIIIMEHSLLLLYFIIIIILRRRGGGALTFHMCHLRISSKLMKKR